jgi:hypothetical protein
MAQSGDAGLELAQIGRYAGVNTGRRLLIKYQNSERVYLRGGSSRVQLARAPGCMLRLRELGSQLDSALAVPGHQGSAEILETWH